MRAVELGHICFMGNGQFEKISERMDVDIDGDSKRIDVVL